MNTTSNPLNQLHDLAHCRAEALRREAMDNFWHGANGVLASSADSARRSAQRLANRLARRAREHNVSVPTRSADA